MFWAGVLPVLTVNLVYAWNLAAGLDGCFPYLDGCTSVSRGVRSGPGVWLFKVMAVPIAACMMLAWWRLPPALRGRAIIIMGITGAAFFLVYAMALGTDGEIYRWMRRYGVVFYFGLTGLAQLWLMSRLRRRLGSAVRIEARWPWRILLTVAVVTWSLGVLSALKRRLFDDPEMVDRLQNALEWNFALGLSLVFVALWAVLKRCEAAAGGAAGRAR